MNFNVHGPLNWNITDLDEADGVFIASDNTFIEGGIWLFTLNANGTLNSFNFISTNS